MNLGPLKEETNLPIIRDLSISNLERKIHPYSPQSQKRRRKALLTSPLRKRGRSDPVTPPWQLILPYTPTKPPCYPDNMRQEMHKDFTDEPPKKRIPVGPATAKEIAARQYQYFGTPPRRPRFEDLYKEGSSRLRGLGWNQLPDINTPRRPPPDRIAFTPASESPTKNNHGEYTHTTQHQGSQSPNIIFEDCDLDDTLSVFACYAATSPIVAIRYRSMMRKSMKKPQGSCGNATVIGGSIVALSTG
ncbi:hypothetical protein TWF718_003060 [Orbilia javanica]|uniref:Uncharacterized protein n=1 Tax=Orbilia javanica TaxID=47235 RepID=A0AAN8RJB4_9PEZI